LKSKNNSGAKKIRQIVGKVDTKKRQYLNSNVNLLFPAKVDYMRASEDIKKKLPIIFDGKSVVVAKTDEISNLKFIHDLSQVTDYMDNM
jgi:hypothetical protein